MTPKGLDVVVVGAGPNGLAAAITLARAGRSVRVFEGASRVGGGTRSAALTLPGFVHDVCSAIHPLAAGSPFFRSLSLDAHELELVHAPDPLAHPLDDGTAVLLKRSVEATAADFGPDAGAYRALMAPLVRDWPMLAEPLLGPLRMPRRPVTLARFGVVALRSAVGLARARFTEPRARALLAGLAAHCMLPLDRIPSAAFALVLGVLGHAYGWPVVRTGSQRIADVLASRLQALGGTVVTGHVVTSVEEIADVPHALLDVTPRQLLRMAGARLPRSYRRRLSRYRYGPGVYKMDWALDGPVPWRAPECARAATVHVGGTLEEIVEAEAAVGRGEHPERPFVLLAQPSLFDETRAPAGKHTAWAYCHVPLDSGST